MTRITKPKISNRQPFGGRAWAILMGLALPMALLVAGSVRAQDGGQGRLRAALGELDALTQQALRQTGIPGLAIAVVYRDEVVYLKGYGVREAGTDRAVDADTVFQLA